MNRSTRRWGAVALVATIALTACGDDDGADVRNIDGTESGSPSGSGSPSAPASGSGSGSPTEAGE